MYPFLSVHRKVSQLSSCVYVKSVYRKVAQLSSCVYVLKSVYRKVAQLSVYPFLSVHRKVSQLSSCVYVLKSVYRKVAQLSVYQFLCQSTSTCLSVCLSPSPPLPPSPLCCVFPSKLLKLTFSCNSETENHLLKTFTRKEHFVDQKRREITRIKPHGQLP